MVIGISEIARYTVLISQQKMAGTLKNNRWLRYTYGLARARWTGRSATYVQLELQIPLANSSARSPGTTDIGMTLKPINPTLS